MIDLASHRAVAEFEAAAERRFALLEDQAATRLQLVLARERYQAARMALQAAQERYTPVLQAMRRTAGQR